MRNTLTDQAIEAALHQDWHQAIDYNLRILEKDPHHIPTLNRLARAYNEIGQTEKARSTYKQVLEIDKYNQIAQKNVTYLNGSANGNVVKTPMAMVTNFVEEPGVTRTLPLIRLGDPKLITLLRPGQLVKLILRNHAICIMTEAGAHIGALTDDIAYQLKEFLQAGNQYQAVIKSANVKHVTVFVRETYRVDKYKNTPTFSHFLG